jgi:hypothetical protein
LRATGLANLLRLTGTYISGPLAEHTIGSRTNEHLAALLGTSAAMDRPVREFVIYTMQRIWNWLCGCMCHLQPMIERLQQPRRQLKSYR